MPNRGDESTWANYQRYVLSEMKRLSDDQVEQWRVITDIRIAAAVSRGRDMAITAAVSLVMSGVVAYVVGLLKKGG